MCGIVGYIGKKPALPVLLDGLKRLEYRGYDSSGMAIINNKGVKSIKAVGKIIELEKRIVKTPKEESNGHIGIAHTRWATHGKPSERNAHPHADCTGKLWLVHNGIIENHHQLRKFLEEKGHRFRSETDTEVILHLIEDLYRGNLEAALKKALPMIQGAYGIVMFHCDEPGRLLAAKCGSPLVIGKGSGEMIVASDVSAVLKHTRKVIYLEDGEMAIIKSDGAKILNDKFKKINKSEQKIEWDLDQAEKNGYAHFMLKEIMEQPETIINSLRGRTWLKEGKAKLGGLENVLDQIKKIDRFIMVGCGTTYHAALVGKYMLEEFAGIPAQVDAASEFRYRQTVIDGKTAMIAISQSGETADTLAALHRAKEKKILTLGLVNVVGSSIARYTDAGVYNHIGPEIAVASTKVLTSQITILALMTVLFGRQRQMLPETGKKIIRALVALPGQAREVLKADADIKKIAHKYAKYKNFAFLGRKYNFPIALEGALKLKETSYIHAEGFSAGEMKHGPIAMIDKSFPCLFIVPQDSVYEKNLSNMAEIKARGGRIIALATQGDKKVRKLADDVIYIPKTLEMLTPILATIPLQLFAYYMAVFNKRDVDKPRNLAKCVTVE